jgi:hypothetical protein
MRILFSFSGTILNIKVTKIKEAGVEYFYDENRKHNSFKTLLLGPAVNYPLFKNHNNL